MTVKTITLNGIVYFFFDALNKSLPFILLPILTHYLSAEDLGLVAEFVALLGIASVLVGLSIHGAVSVAFFKLEKENISSYVFNALLILVISTLFVLIICIPLGGIYDDNGNLPIYWIYILVITAALQFVTNINLILWQAEKRALNYGLYQFIQSFLFFSLTLILVILFSMDWQGRIVGQVASVSILALLSFYFLLRRRYLVFELNVDYIRDALKFGIPLIPHGLASWVFIGFNIILISSILGNEQAGIFSVAMQFAFIVTVIAQAANRAIQPILYQKLSNIVEDEKHTIVKYTYYGFVIIFIVGGAVWLLSLLAIEIFVDEKFHEAKKYLPYLVLAGIFDGLYLLVVNYIFYTNKNNYLAIATIIVALVHISIAINLVQILGMQGVAISSVISMAIYFVFVWVLSAKSYPMPWALRIR